MSSRSFIYGTAVLLTASIFNRGVGFIYQILMMRLIKPEGVGLFSMIFPIYIMVLVLASLGIPVAIAKLVAEEVAVDNLPGAYRIFKISLSIIAACAVVITILLYMGTPFLISHVFPNPKVYLCFVSLIPGVLIVSLCSAFRGFFQGLQRMSPTAVTQAVEQLVRVTAGLSIAWILLPRGIEFASVGISLGVICGELAGFIIMLFIYITRRPRFTVFKASSEPFPQIMGRIFNMGIPVTLTRFVSTALMSLDALLIPRRLQSAGMSLSEATSSYGQFVGISEAIFFTPGVVTVALATALMPAVSDAMALGKINLVRSRIEDAFRITLIMGLLVAAIFLVLPQELCSTLFGYGAAGGALFILALSSPFLYLQQTVNGILQGLGRPDIPFKNLLKSSIVKIMGIYFLTSIPGFGILGTALAMGSTYVFMCLLNYLELKKITGFKIDPVPYLLKPLAAAGAAAVLMFYLKMITASILTGLPGLLLKLACGGFSYFFILYIIGGINASDIRRVRLILRR